MLTLPITNSQLVWLFRLALIVNLVAVSWLAFTGTRVEVATMFSDKINHLVAFLMLAYCLDRSFPRWSFARIKIWPLLFYGLLIEIVQSHLAYRDFSMLDMLTDAGALIIYWFIRMPMRRLIVAK